MNIVLSVNDNPTYFSFLEKAASFYIELGHKVYVAYVTDKDAHPWGHLNIERVEIFPLIDGFDSGVQGKLGRSFLASQLEDDDSLFTLMDVDQFLIDFDWFYENIKFDKLNDADILGFGANGFRGKFKFDKFMLSFCTGTPKGFRKLFGIDKGIHFSDFLNKFSIIESSLDGRECTKNIFNDFSDESLFTWLVINNNIKVNHINIPGMVHQRRSKTIDRTISIMLEFGIPNFDANFWNQKSLTQEQKTMIHDGWFIDVCPPRPYENYRDIIDDIVKTIIEKEKSSGFLVAEEDFENISSEPYISAYTFATICDHMWLGNYQGTPYLNKYSKPINPNAVKDGDILFVKTSEFVQFMRQVDPHIGCKYTLICGMGDDIFDNSLSSLISDNIIKVFTTNNVSDDSRVFTIPLGLQNLHWQYDNNPQSNFNLLDEINLEPIQKIEQILMSFRIETNPRDREPCHKYFQNKPFISIRDFTQEDRKDEEFVKDYFREIRKHKFVLCPFGNGFDCHRMWETWALGSFPIIKKHKSMEDFYDLPAWFVDNWDEVTEETIDVIYDNIVEKNATLEKTTFEYWENMIL